MGTIVTFYSYKGGVGRSMALTNVAFLLAQRGLKVLVIDWDLEAPGLERYFSYFVISGERPGLLRLFMDARGAKAGSIDYRAHCAKVECNTPHPITLLPSGREQDEDYSHHLERFEWDAFFRDHGGGALIESLRNQWRDDFDIVLIDSRTGLSDTGGICTIQLPDVVVAMFTANTQSLYGVRDVMRLAQRARQGLAYERMPLSVLPLPARWGMQEFRETQVWIDRVAEVVQEFLADWLPRPLTARDVVERLRVPQRDFFSFGEKLAVIEEGTSDPTGMGFVYDRVAGFLASDLRDIGALLGPDQAKRVSAARKERPSRSEQGEESIDVFVSHDGSQTEWILEFVDVLRKLLGSRLGRSPVIFFDQAEIKVGDVWQEQIETSLRRSRVLLPILTPRYAESRYARMELHYFVEHAGGDAQAAVFPVMLRGGREPPPLLAGRVFTDLREYPLRSSSGATPPWIDAVLKLADAIGDHLTRQPPPPGKSSKRAPQRKKR